MTTTLSDIKLLSERDLMQSTYGDLINEIEKLERLYVSAFIQVEKDRDFSNSSFHWISDLISKSTCHSLFNSISQERDLCTEEDLESPSNQHLRARYRASREIVGQYLICALLNGYTLEVK